MNEDYLWDKTGEPDPEIQQLEQVLGTLRYQPRPLDIPAGVAPSHKRSLFPRLLAIAATIAMLLLGAGLWFSLQKQQTPEPATAGSKTPGTSGGTGAVAAGPPDQAVVPAPPQQPTPQQVNKPSPRRNRGLSSEMANNGRPRVNPTELTAMELKEAEAGKAQLMLALRVASTKLSFAQKKAQEINSENMVHNQHKAG